jgi:hypothetical protein
MMILIPSSSIALTPSAAAPNAKFIPQLFQLSLQSPFSFLPLLQINNLD